MAAQIFGRRVEHEIDAELQRTLVIRRGESRIDQRFNPVPLADGGEALEIDDAIVRIGRRFADQQTSGRTDRLFDCLVVARRHHRDFDAVAVQNLGQKLPRAPIGIVGHDHMRIVRKHGVHRRRHRGHATGKQQAILGAFQRGEFLLGDALGRVAVAAVFFALDAALEVIVQLLGIGERVGRGLHNRRSERIAELGPRLAAVHRQSAEAERFAVATR